MERTVAGDMDNRLIWKRNLRPHRGAIAEAHRTKPARREKMPDFFAAVILCGPKLVLADIGGDDHIVPRHLVNRPQQLVWVDDTVVVLRYIIERPLPFGNLRAP